MQYCKFLGILLLSGIFIAGCSKKSDESQAPDTSKDITVKINTEWEEYKQDVKAQIDTNESRLTRLRNRTGIAIQKAVDSLEARNEDLKKRLSEFRADTETGWNEFKREFSHDMEQLGTAIADLFRNNAP